MGLGADAAALSEAPVPGRVSRRRRVLFVIGTLEVGGAEVQLTRLATHLDPRRFEAEICCLSDGGPLARDAEAHGVPVHVLGLRSLNPLREPLEVLSRLADLLRLLRRRRPDVVHGFLFWGYVLGALAGRLTGAPVVVSSRRSLGDFKKGRPLFRAIEQVANRCSDLLVANSEAVRDDVIRTEGADPARIVVVPNGLRLPEPDMESRARARRSLGLGERGLVVGVIANLIHYKGHRFLVEAWARVVARTPGARALLFGDGPMRGAIEEQVRDLGIGDSIVLLGRVENARDLLPALDLYVQPSLEEGFSNAILEAMAAGLPVVATDVGGNREAVRDGVTGCLVPPADAGRLALAVAELLEDPEARRLMGAAGREAAGRYSVERMVAAYEKIYTEHLDERER
ncbi:MAG: glycosyltransferase [Thermoanaerobaculia bacterium]